MTERVCGLCDGTGKRLRRIGGGMASDLVDCFACDGTGVQQPLPPIPPRQGEMFR